MSDSNARIESKLEVQSYLQNLKYALDNGAIITFQEVRKVDNMRDVKFSNAYTVAKLFPDEDPVDALRRELRSLKVEEYIRTVRDIRFPDRSDMREFGRVYNENDEVYIKIRVELLGDFGTHTTFVMSFHFAAENFTDDIFPYK